MVRILIGSRTPREQQGSDGGLSLTVRAAPRVDELTEWDQLVRVTPGTDVTQLSAWARVRGHVGYSALYVFVREGSRLVAGAQLLHRRVLRLASVGYIPYGPIVTPTRRTSKACRLLGDALLALGTHRLHALFIQPPEGGEALRKDLVSAGFQPSYVAIAPLGSLRVDLHADEQELRARARRRLRPAEKLWEKHHVTVREGDERDLPILARLLACSAHVHGFRPATLDYLQALYRELRPGGHVSLLIADADGVPLAADLLTINADMVRGRFVGFDRFGWAPRSAAPAALTWAGITWAKNHGLRWYDVGGLPESVLSDMLDRGVKHSPDWPSTTLAKLGWGATPFRYPAPIELIRPRALWSAYKFSEKNPAANYFVTKAVRWMRG
jgi:SAM-dependent methyltransferase